MNNDDLKREMAQDIIFKRDLKIKKGDNMKKIIVSLLMLLIIGGIGYYVYQSDFLTNYLVEQNWIFNFDNNLTFKVNTEYEEEYLKIIITGFETNKEDVEASKFMIDDKFSLIQLDLLDKNQFLIKEINITKNDIGYDMNDVMYVRLRIPMTSKDYRKLNMMMMNPVQLFKRDI